MKPGGALNTLCRNMARIAKWQDAIALDAYVASDEFAERFAIVKPRFRPTVMRTYYEVRQKCRVKPAEPKGREPLRLWTPERLTELAKAYRKHGSDWARIGQDLAISKGAARLACKRLLLAGATQDAGKAPGKPQDGRFDPGHRFTTPAGGTAVLDSRRGAEAYPAAAFSPSTD